ncbi:MAG: Plug domain-containing protein, partial [Muribaculaceae bacterium]|nr:Plug domain-containing protein [Muribaculaceae bacterium]
MFDFQKVFVSGKSVSTAACRALALGGALLSAVPAGYGIPLAEGATADDIARAASLLQGSLDEVVVTGQSARQRVDGPRLGVENLELAKLAQVPQLFGENDIIKSIALMPGVRGEGDGGGGFEVRGGTASQNLIQLDGITLYNPSHVMGIFSTFNDDALGRATLFKGPFPAQFGGAT